MRRQLFFLIDAVTGTGTEAMIIPQLGAISDYVADAKYLIERITLITSETWTAGTATLYTRLDGSQGATAHCLLNTDNQWQDQAAPDPNNAEHQIDIGQRIGLDLVTASWTPATADMLAIMDLSKLT